MARITPPGLARMDPAEREELEAWFREHFRAAVSLNGLLDLDQVEPLIQKAGRWAALVQESQQGLGAAPAPPGLPKIIRMRPARRFAWYVRVYASLLRRLALTPESHGCELAARASDGRVIPGS